MKRLVIAFAALASVASGDTIKLTNGGTLEGVVLRETETSVVVKLKYGTVTLSKSDVASIERTQATAAKTDARLASWERCVEVVVARPWAADFQPIPATVIDKGILKNVPYFSHRAGDYEFNIYGDPDRPACLEIGVHKELLKSDAAKKECLEVMLALLGDEKDRELLKSLSVKVDKKEREGLTLEVTPETAEDAYGGWWISIYDVKMLDAARATEKELADITTSDEEIEKEEKEAEEEKKKPKKDPPPQADPPKKGGSTTAPYDPYGHYRWGTRELRWARPRIQTTPRRVYVRGFHRSGGRYVRPSWGVRRR